MNGPAATAVAGRESCWRQLGVFGDGSCGELETYVHCRNCPRFAAAARSLLARMDPAPATVAARGESQAAAAERAADLGVLVFRLAGMVLGIDAGFAAELAVDQRARRIAHRSGRLLEGLVNIRGELHLCIALDRMLGLERNGADEHHGTPRLVVVRDGSADPWVFRADAVLGVERYARSGLTPPPPAAPAAIAPFMRGMIERSVRAQEPVSARRASARVVEDWPSRLLLLDGRALLAGLENAVY